METRVCVYRKSKSNVLHGSLTDAGVLLVLGDVAPLAGMFDSFTDMFTAIENCLKKTYGSVSANLSTSASGELLVDYLWDMGPEGPVYRCYARGTLEVVTQGDAPGDPVVVYLERGAPTQPAGAP